MNENGLYPFIDVARMLNVSRHTVRDLVNNLGLVPKRMTNGRAKGLDRADIARLRALLGGDRPQIRRRTAKV